MTRDLPPDYLLKIHPHGNETNVYNKVNSRYDNHNHNLSEGRSTPLSVWSLTVH
jgi:hypothetical protein